MSEPNSITNDSKSDKIRSLANLYITSNVINDRETGFKYYIIEELADMIALKNEDSCIIKYRREKDTLPEAERINLYDRCCVIPLIAYSLFDAIVEGYDAIESKRKELVELTGLDFYFPEIIGDLNGNTGFARDDFWKKVNLLHEEFPPRGKPDDDLLKKADMFAVNIEARMSSDNATRESIPNDVLISDIKKLIENN